MNKKKIIIFELKRFLKENSFIKDIWLYGNFEDEVSDLDLLVLYDNNVKKVKISKIIQDYILDGTIIYIPYKLKNEIFLFENLKIFSIKKNKAIKHKLNLIDKQYQLLTSFIERYYERRQMLFLSNIYSPNDKIIRNIKSLIFSYDMFFQYLSLKETKVKKKNLFISYKKIRKKYLNNKLKKKEYKFYIEKLKKFDENFFLKSLNYLNQSFEDINMKKFSYLFLKKYTFSNFAKKKSLVVPKLFGAIYQFYAYQNLNLSKKIRKDFKGEKKINLNNDKFKNFLRKKISFINQSYTDLKRIKFKKGMYRFSWYLN